MFFASNLEYQFFTKLEIVFKLSSCKVLQKRLKSNLLLKKIAHFRGKLLQNYKKLEYKIFSPLLKTCKQSFINSFTIYMTVLSNKVVFAILIKNKTSELLFIKYIKNMKLLW